MPNRENYSVPSAFSMSNDGKIDRRRPNRVMYLGHSAMLGGAEIALFNLIRNLDRESVDPTVVLCSDGPLAEQLRPICRVQILPLTVRIGTVKKDSIGWHSLLKVRDATTLMSYCIRLAAFVRKNQFDVIHTNSLKADIIGGIVGRLASRPVIWHVRDRIEPDYLPTPVVRVFRLLCRLLPAYVIANSEATLKTLHLTPCKPATSVPSGIDLSGRASVVLDATIIPKSTRESEAAARRKPVIGLIGRISFWKGQHIFLKAAAIVRDQFPEATFRIIGAALFGEKQYEKEVRELCTRLGLDDCVEFTGFRSDVSDLIARLDVVVHASTTGEPFGQVIIEGMAASKPVVATDGGGVPEIVVDGVTGLLVPMKDASAMADAICRLLADSALAHRMGAAGLQRVREHFTIEKAARRVESVYSFVLDRGHSSN
jgi:glycosyltransferase involved in cell wall biosynthesis